MHGSTGTTQSARRPKLPEQMWIAAGASAGFLVAAFFLSGFHHEVRYRLRQRKRGGMIW